MEDLGDVWMYRSPEGDEFGPYTRSEVRRYAAEGRILHFGSLRKQSESGWRRASEILEDLSVSPPVVPPGDPVREKTDATSEPYVPATTKPRGVSGGTSSSVSRTAFVLLGILPGAVVFIFGIHNLIAGYTAKGVCQLVLSLVLVWGMGCLGAIFGVPICIAIPAYLGLLTWTIVEVCTVMEDAQGRKFVA